jgi:predicted TIM-barrel fold metal-dependent hydrolase
VATGPGQRSGAAAATQPASMGPHADDPRMNTIWERVADLGMPINLHVSDPYWSYLPQDRYNDGLMNGFSWRLDDKPGLMGHDALVASMERVCARHPRCVFVAAHLVNLDYDLTRLGQLFERHPNLYADISARFCETSPVPRAASAFLARYGHRVVYGTDIPYTTKGMFELTFRIMETPDEHFYARDIYFNFDYHWPMHGFGLPDEVLKKVYRESALNAIAQARRSAKA